MTNTPIPVEDEALTTTPVGHRIRARRLELGLSQADIAEGMLSPSYVSLVESGRRQPATGALAHIAERLGVDVEYLRDGVDASVRAKARLTLSRAQVALRQGDAGVAYEQLTSLIDDPGLNDEQQRTAQLGRALARERLGNLEGAIAVLTDLADLARTAPEAYPWLDVAVAAARCYRQVGDFAKGIQIGEEAMRSAKELGLEGTDEYVQLGVTVLAAYGMRGDIVHATALSKHLISLADQVGTPQTRGAAYWNASLIAEQRGEIAQALQLIDRAEAMFGESDDRRNLARLRGAYAELLLHDPDREQAEQALRRLDAIRPDIAQVGSTTDLSAVDSTRARALIQLGRLTEAREAAQAALDHIGTAANLRRANAQLVRAEIRRLEGDFEGSLQDGTSAAATLEELGTSQPAAAAWRVLGDLYRVLDRKDEALVAYDRALHSLNVSGATPSQVLTGASRTAASVDLALAKL